MRLIKYLKIRFVLIAELDWGEQGKEIIPHNSIRTHAEQFLCRRVPVPDESILVKKSDGITGSCRNAMK